MFITRSPLLVVMLGAIAVVALDGTCATAQERKRGADSKDASIVKGTLASVDADKNTVTVTTRTFNRATQEATETNKTYPLAKDAQVLQDAAAARLADLRKGFTVTLKLDGANASSVSVDGGTTQGKFLSANPDRNTIAVVAGRENARRVYHLLKSTTIIGADGKAMLLKDLAAGTKLVMTRSVEDDNTVVHIKALPETDK